jgi:hypothetical protein
MQPMTAMLIVSTLLLGACASQPTAEEGKHLVYRDASGKPTMQIDYPSTEFCRRVKAIARRDSRCEAISADSQLHARATLRYNPGDMLVEGHYPDVASCEKANSTMARGVELAKPCTAK